MVDIYLQLPQKDRAAIEEITGRLWVEKNRDSFGRTYSIALITDYLGRREMGKAFFKACMAGELALDLNLILKALREYKKYGSISVTHNMASPYDESIKWPFFKIKNSLGQTRGYILGSSHKLPVSFCRLRREIQSSFSEATAFFPEIDVLKKRSLEALERRLPPRKGYFCVDITLLAKAKLTGKKIVNAEDKAARKKLIKKAHHPKFYSNIPNRENLLEVIVKDASGAITSGSLVDILKVYKKANALEGLKKEHEAEVEMLSHHKRNKMMSRRVNCYLKDNPQATAFVVVGAAHLLNTEYSYGVLSRLIDKGWSIFQV